MTELQILEITVQPRTTTGNYACGAIKIHLGDQEKTYQWAATR